MIKYILLMVDLLRNIKFISNCLLETFPLKYAFYLAGVNGILYLLTDLDEIWSVTSVRNSVECWWVS